MSLRECQNKHNSDLCHMSNIGLPLAQVESEIYFFSFEFLGHKNGWPKKSIHSNVFEKPEFYPKMVFLPPYLSRGVVISGRFTDVVPPHQIIHIESTSRRPHPIKVDLPQLRSLEQSARHMRLNTVHVEVKNCLTSSYLHLQIRSTLALMSTY